MQQYRFKLAQDIHPDDLMQICSIQYEVVMTRPRSVGQVEKYIQVFARVFGSDPSEDNDITIVFPKGALVKIKSRKKHGV